MLTVDVLKCMDPPEGHMVEKNVKVILANY